MGSLGSIPRYLAGESQNRKNQKSKTHASENRLYRSRIAGNFDTAKFQGATTARTRVDGSFLLGHQGDLEEMERTKRTNQKTENSKENRDIKGIRGNSKKKTHQSEIGDQKKNRNIDQGNLGEMKAKKHTNQKIEDSKMKENPEIHKK